MKIYLNSVDTLDYEFLQLSVVTFRCAQIKYYTIIVGLICQMVHSEWSFYVEVG